MNNGSGNSNATNPNGSALSQNIIVNDELYARTKAQVENARAQLDMYERTLEAGYRNWVSQEEQELLRRIEEGRQAERRLAQRIAQNRQAMEASVAGPSAWPSNTSANMNNVATSRAIPPQTSIRADERPIGQHSTWTLSPGLSSNPLSSNVPRGASASQTEGYYSAPTAQSAQHPQSRPGVSTFLQAFQSPQNRSDYGQNGPPTQPFRNGGATYIPVQNPLGQHGEQLHTGSTQQNPPRPNNGLQNGMPTSTSSGSALGVNHAKVTYTSRANKTNHSGPGKDPEDSYTFVFNTVKGFPPEVLDYVLREVCIALKAKFPKGIAENASRASILLTAKNIKEQYQIIIKHITSVLEKFDGATIIRIVQKIRMNMRPPSVVPAPHLPTSNTPHQNLTPYPAQPPAPQATPPNATGIPLRAVPEVAPISTNSSANGIAPSINPSGGGTFRTTSTSNFIPYMPQRWDSPALHNAPGNTYTGPQSMGATASNENNASASLSQSATYRPPAPTAFAKTPEPASRQSTSNALPGRPPSPWTPAKANKSRLAQDIMRSLGRPTTLATSVLSLPAYPPGTNDFQMAKRRRTESASSDSSKKRQKAHSSPATTEIEEIATDGATELAVWQQVNVANAEAHTSEDGEAGVTREDVHEETLVTTVMEDGAQAAAGPSDLLSALNANMSASSTSGSSIPFASGTHTLAALQESAFEANTGELALGRNDLTDDDITPGSALPRQTSASAPPTSRTTSPITLSPQRSVHNSPQTLVFDESKAGPSTTKTPLFLPSPSTTHGDDDANISDIELLDSVVDVDDQVQDSESGKTSLRSDFPSVGFPSAKSKGKRKALVLSSDDEVEFVETSKPYRKATAYSKKLSGRTRSDNYPYVLVPPVPSWVKRVKTKLGKAHVPSSVGHDASPNNDDEFDQLGQDDVMDEARRIEDQSHQAAVQLSCSRLHESPCRWRGCDAVLNSTDGLIKHVALHAGDGNVQTNYTCEWLGCGRKLGLKTGLLHHLGRHASQAMYCAYEGCERSFSTAKELLHHHNSLRHQGQPLKRPWVPSTPPQTDPLPPLPPMLPGYMTIPRRITRHPISKQVHQWLGARVLENISSYHFNGRQLHAGKPSRSSRRLAEQIAAIEQQGHDPATRLDLVRRMTHDEYDSIAPGSSLKALKRCDDMAQYEASSLVDKGLVLFPPPGMESGNDVAAVQNELDELDFLSQRPEDQVGGGASNSGAVDDMQTLQASGGAVADHLEQVGEGVVGQAVAQALDSFMVIQGDDPSSHQPAQEDESQRLPGWTVLAGDSRREEEAVEGLL